MVIALDAAPVRLGTAPTAVAAAIRSLYLHTPFCERKCSYCDFVSVGGARGQRDYAAALLTELRLLGAAFPGVTLDTVFLGGGTPSLLEPRLLADVLGTVRECFTLAPGAEVTMEANPSSTSERRATAWLAAGVNRVSIGVQSLEPDILRFLDRIHDCDRALDAVRAVQRAGVPRVSTDLIYAVPGLDDARWERTLDTVLGLGCEHLSCYELTVEEGTPLAGAVAGGEVATADPETALRQHWIAVDRAARAGLAQYEVSNFAREGAECRHNLAYWRNAWWLAAGAGAHGHVPAAAGVFAAADAAVAVRYRHTPSIPAYVAALEQRRLPVVVETIDARASEEELLLGGLRLREGVVLRDPRRLAEARALARGGFVEVDGDRVRVTRRGQEVLNEVIARLVTAA